MDWIYEHRDAVFLIVFVVFGLVCALLVKD